jgi:hypothetical protein
MLGPSLIVVRGEAVPYRCSGCSGDGAASALPAGLRGLRLPERFRSSRAISKAIVMPRSTVGMMKIAIGSPRKTTSSP